MDAPASFAVAARSACARSPEATQSVRRLDPLGVLAAVWGVAGVALLLSRAILRLWPVALEALSSELGPVAWAAAAGWIGAMAYFEGYRGFQRGFSPRVVARAAQLARGSTFLRAALAPLYCMSLFAAERRRTIVSWSLVATMVALVVLVPSLGQPARGIIDAGVVVGLAWGLAAIGAESGAALARARAMQR
jgi:hypothetical protein